ncbi:MAG: capsular polysaccharide biosynthesis protein [Pseudomonadota bacterium]
MEGRDRLFVYSGGFLTQRRVRRILQLKGWRLRTGLPGPADWVGVWGASPTAHRGHRVAHLRGAPVLSVEDAFLRSLHPGRAGEPPLGLLLDRSGVHFDPDRPSDLETCLATHPLDDPQLLDRAEAGMTRMITAHLSKYSATDPDLPLPDPGYVLVIDQTVGDASVRASRGDKAAFEAMLACARREHPKRRIVLKAHPETVSGQRAGHLDRAAGVEVLTTPVAPGPIMARAHAIYTYSSGLGFEAVLHGLRPVVFGQPFYAGWGLTDDRGALLARRTRTLNRSQLFAAAMIIFPTWYDPYRDALCEFETVLDTLDAQARAWRADRQGYVSTELSRWKHRHMRATFGGSGKFEIISDPVRAAERAEETGKPLLVWAGRAQAVPPAPRVMRVEDGFLRSNGLGARLVPPASLAVDDMGIYYDPGQPSRLEHLIAASPRLLPAEIARSARLRAMIVAAGLSKYNIGQSTGTEGAILVPGQVEDDASIQFGAGDVATNEALLKAVRTANPDARIVYKPHPDVEAGLRQGALPEDRILRFADAVARNADPIALLATTTEVWTITSLLGFEALLRGIPVTTIGAPFYAGWGLTRDFGKVPERRTARPSLDALVHAVLIDYPRYHDPVTNLPCPPEVIVERLAAGAAGARSPIQIALGRIQALIPNHWRR